MTDLDFLKKFAADVDALAKEASTLAGMAKQANVDLKEAQAKITAPLSNERLAKAASAVVKLYGDRASVTPDALQRIWGADHNTIVDSLTKIASDSITQKVREPAMVAVKKAQVKTASAASSNIAPDSTAHRKAFDDIFGIR